MNCTEFLSKLTDYFDGQISPELLEEVRAHLEKCGHCKVVLNTTRQTIEIYHDNKMYEIPDALMKRLHAAIMAKCCCRKPS